MAGARRAAPPQDTDGVDIMGSRHGSAGYDEPSAMEHALRSGSDHDEVYEDEAYPGDAYGAEHDGAQTYDAGAYSAETDDAAEPDEDDEHARRHERRHHGPAWAALWLAVVLVGLAALGYVGYAKGLSWVRDLTAPATDYPGPGGASVTVTIPDLPSPATVASILVDKDVVASTKAFTNAVRADPSTFKKIMAGDHTLKIKMSAVQAYNALADPSLFTQKQFTVPDGLRDTQVFTTINKQTGVPVADLQAVANDAGQLGLPSWAETTNAEGYLFPDTYGYDDNPTAAEVLGRMVTQFVRVTNSLDFAAKAQANGLSPAQAVVLASIIEKEGSNPEYAADIAQVFYNRLKAGMPLQSDATVLYACNVTGSLTTTDAQRTNAASANCPDPDYNTYVHTGLPPGPISNPGQDALTAAVNPTSGDYLYFVVTDPSTGEVAFSSTLAQHQANVAKFQAWCQANPGKC